MKNKTWENGFTLLEMMIVVAVLAIIAGIGAPLLLKALPGMNLKSAARDIFSVMMQAKSQALQRGVNVTLLFTPAGQSYILFLDNGAGGGTANDCIVNGTEPVIQTTTFLPNWVSFDPTNVNAGPTGVSFTRSALIFNSQGIPIDAITGSPTGGVVGLRAVNSKGVTTEQRSITVTLAGGIKMQ